MPHFPLRSAALATALAAVALSGCASYVKRAEFDSAIAELRATDARLQEQINALSQKHDALVTQMAGRVRVDAGAHLSTNESTLSHQDKPLLDDFAKVIRDSHSDALITVEGFADPSDASTYNRRLGQRRAEAVRDYLRQTGGLPAGQVLSYGEDRNRQVRAGATGEAGRDNRRVSLVIDYAGASAATSSSTM